ncbi:MAG: hypothetical protein ABW133_22995 [Polyangiaceae bacterium]
MPHDQSKPLGGQTPRPTGAGSPVNVRPAVEPKKALAWIGALLAASGAVGCAAESDKQTYDPVALGMTADSPPFYDDGETTIYQVKRPISIPIVRPTDADRMVLAPALPPYARTPWITIKDVRVQVTWTISNLEKQARNVELLIDPWNEFARYVPGFNVGEEETVPDLSGIDLLMRVEGMSRKKGVFTFDDMDEVATDLATAQNIIGANADPATAEDGVNGLVNHTFEIHNRSNDNDLLIKRYIPKTIAGLVGFDLGLRTFAAGNVAVEVIVEVMDHAGNRVAVDDQLKLDGSMWMTPDVDLTAPMGDVR